MLPPCVWIHLGGWLLVYRGIWLTKQLLMWYGISRRKQDRMFDLIAPRLLLGRLTWSLPSCEGQPEVDMVVDVTCEWSEPSALRAVDHYLAVPVVDTTRPTLEQCMMVATEIVDHLRDPDAGSVYLHCANGYGRSAIVAAAVLLMAGLSDDVDSAINTLKQARPVVSLRPGMTRGMCETITHTELLEDIAAELKRKRAQVSDNESSTDFCSTGSESEPILC